MPAHTSCVFCLREASRASDLTHAKFSVKFPLNLDPQEKQDTSPNLSSLGNIDKYYI